MEDDRKERKEVNFNILILSIIIVVIIVFCVLLASRVTGNTSIAFIDKGFNEPENPNKEVYVIVIGDTGTATESQFKVAKAIEEFCQRRLCAMGIIVGDVIYPRGVTSIDDPGFQEKFEEPYKNIPMPFQIIYGNHDYLGCRECYLDYSNLSTKWQMSDKYYRILYSNVAEFFFINSENFDNEQQIWLEEQIENSTMKYKLVFSHRPLVTYESDHFDDYWPQREAFKSTICNTDYLIAGHSHVLEYIDSIQGCKLEQFISGGGGAEPREMIENPQSTYYASTNGFLAFTFSEEQKISFTYYDVLLEELYRVE